MVFEDVIGESVCSVTECDLVASGSGRVDGACSLWSMF